MPLNIEIEVQDCETLTLEIIDAPVSPSCSIDDDAGLGDTYVTWSADKSTRELADKVDKVAGMGLSELSFTTADKNSLDQSEQDRHTHANKSVIDDLSDNAGALEYRGLPVYDQAALDSKVDKVAGYSLVDDDEIAKLLTVEQDAQRNAVNSVAGKQGDVLLDKSDVGLGAVDNTSDADKPMSTAVADAFAGKVDAEAGKGLSEENYTLAEKDKLAGIADEATKNRADSENADKVHEHDINDVTGLSTRLNEIGNLSQLPTQDKNNLVAAINELILSFTELIPQIDDDAGLDDINVTWSADKSSRELADIGSMIGDVESVLVAINGEP